MSGSKVPITIRVPLVVTGFMVVVSVFASERVLTRLDQTHTTQVQQLSDAHLEGLALALVDGMVREDIWQVFDVLDRSQRRPARVRPTQTIVSGADGVVIASSAPAEVPSQAVVPQAYLAAFVNGQTMAIVADRQVALAKRDVMFEGRSIGTIYASLDIAPLIAERREVLWTLMLTNALLTLTLAVLASVIVGRMMRPIGVLTDHLERSEANRVEVIPERVLAKTRPEYRRAFTAYNALAKAMAERQSLAAQLAEEERLASLGRLASGMAHEINNPLGGLFNAIDTLKRHGAEPVVRAKSLDLIERGLKGIRDVVRSALMTYRADRDGRALKPEDVNDLELLMAPEARRRGVFLAWNTELRDEVPIPASALRQIVLNLVLNACQATPRDACVRVTVTADDQAFELAVEDEGMGLPRAAIEMLSGRGGVPAPIGDGTGLGLWMTSRLVQEHNGTVAIEKGNRGGTKVSVRLPIPTGEALRDVA